MAIGLSALSLGTFVISFGLCLNFSAAQFPSFVVLANESVLSFGDTVAIKCLIFNVTLMDVVTGYTITWLKDDVKITKSFIELADDVIDARYSVNVFAEHGKGLISSLQIKRLTEEDEGVFACELTNKTSAKQQKSVSISVEDRVGNFGTKDSEYESVTRRNSMAYNAAEGIKETISKEPLQPYNTTSWDNTPYKATEGIEETISEETLQLYTTTPVFLNLNKTEATTLIINISSKSTDNETYAENITDRVLTTTTESFSTTDTTTGAFKGEFYPETGSKTSLIVGITVFILILVILAIIIVVMLKRRGGMNCEKCYHKPKVNVYEATPVDFANESFKPEYKNEGYSGLVESDHKYVNNEQAIRVRRAYEDANDKRFLCEYETNQNLRRKSSDKEGGNGVSETLVRDDSSDSDCLDHSQDHFDDVSKKKKKSPYEKCHDITFLQNF